MWDYDEWGVATDAALALEEALHTWLEIKTCSGAEQQIWRASTPGKANANEVGEESGNDSDSAESSDEEDNNMHRRSGVLVPLAPQAGGLAASGAHAGVLVPLAPHADVLVASGTHAGGLAASGAPVDCVLTKRNGRLQVLSWEAWQTLYNEQVAAKMPARERELHLCNMVLGHQHCWSGSRKMKLRDSSF